MREATGLWESLPWPRPLHAMAWSWPLCPVYVRSPLSGDDCGDRPSQVQRADCRGQCFRCVRRRCGRPRDWPSGRLVWSVDRGVLCLATWQEGISLWAGEPALPLQKIAARANGYMAIAVQFAVPTTLNNLAGGIAVGISPWLSGHVGLLRLPCDDGDRLLRLGQRLHSVLRGSQLDVRLFTCVSSLGPSRMGR
jgi:hypothetical protein